jgi:AraC-like DNA-binding protein
MLGGLSPPQTNVSVGWYGIIYPRLSEDGKGEPVQAIQKSRERGMGGPVVTVEIDDPHEITPAMWEWFRPTPTSAISPKQFLARDYRAGDWRHYQIDPRSYHTTASVGKIGQICFVRVSDRQATDMVVGQPGLDHYCLSYMQSGAGVLHQPGGTGPTEIEAGSSAIFPGEPRTVLRTGAAAAKINVWIPAGLLHRQAAVLLEGSDTRAFSLGARIDGGHGTGGSLMRLTEALFAELAHPDSLLSNQIGAAPAQELFLQSVVMAATNGGRASVRRSGKPAAPGTVRRAEEYMRRSAEEPLTVEAIACAAGCSVRALQLAFKRFRGTSPMEALRRLRLRLAYEAIMRCDGSSSVTEVAVRHGFTNAGRFAAEYRRVFGEYPSEALRSRGGNGP